MKKTVMIRDALAGGALPFRQLHLKIGGDKKKLHYLCNYLRTRGELKIAGDEDRTVTLLRSGGGKAAPRKSKKPAGKKAVKRPYKRLVEKHAARHAANGTELGALVLDNLLAAAAELRQAIKDQVEGLEEDAVIQSALANLERAEKILAAARGA